MNNIRSSFLLRLYLAVIVLAQLAFYPQFPVHAAANLTIVPLTWNVIGLDSNNVSVGPNNFPVGARVCNTGDTTANNVSSGFNWEATDPTPAKNYIQLRPGSNASYSGYTLAPGACTDFYYEIQVTRDSNAYNDTRRYYITATADTVGTISTPRPREVFVEHLISQNRNAVTDVKLNGVSTPAGGTMSLMLGNTYNIQLVGSTATQGYEQLESFINFPNTIFQVNSVTSTFSANAGTDPQATTKLYADGCTWVNDPGSPNYRSCVSTGKYGGNITVTYNVTIIGGAGTNQTLNTLIYDFSGSSYHYNADFSTSARLAAIVGPSSVEITKTFTPKAVSPGGTSVLTFKLINPTTETITGVNFTDTLQGGLKVAATPSVGYSGCGSGAFSPVPVANATSLSFSNGTIAPNSSCTITVSVTADTAADYPNTTGNLFINTSVDTGNSGSDTLKVSTASACVPGQTLATWTFPSGSSTTAPVYTTKVGNVSTATASTTTTSPTIDTNIGNPAPSWSGRNFPSTGAVTGDTSPYFQFTIDTSKYSGVQISLSYARDSNWGGGSSATPTIYVWSSTTGAVSSFSQIFSSTTFDTTFRSTGTLSAAATGSSNTYFRVNAVGATNSNAYMQIDTVTVTGCLVPAPAPTITKSFSPKPITKGATSTLTFTINNTAVGNVDQSGISFTDVLPEGLSISNATTSACNGTNNLVTTASTRTISLTGGSLTAGGSCTFNVTVTGSKEGAHENVTGFLSSTESGTSTNYATDTITVIAPPALEKSFSPSSILTGNTSTLQFTITNPNQGTTLTGIGFTDTLPAGVTVANGSFSYCNGTLTITGGNLLTFSGGSINANSACSFSVTVTGTTTGTKNNTTSAVTSTQGGNGNTASATLVVSDPLSLIGLSKQVSTDNATWVKYVGLVPTANIYYKITITNDGETTLNNISVTDPDVNMASCAPALPASLAVGASASCVVGPLSVSSAPSPNPFVNTATVTTSTYSPGTEGTSSARYGTKSLALDKTANKSTYSVAGETIGYSYLVTNDGGYPLLGPVTVTDDKVTVTCPAVSTVGDNDDYFDPGESITCSATYTVLASDMTNGSITNTAHATVDGVDSPNDSVTVNTAPNLSLAKSNGSTTVPAGGTTTYALTVSNTGNTASSGTITVVDVLPSSMSVADGSLTLGGANAANWSCSSTSNVITCTSSTSIAATSGTSVFSFTVNVSASASGTLTNRAQVGGGGDPLTSTPDGTSAGACTAANTPTKGCAIDSDTAVAPNLSLTKTDGVATVTAGGTTTYTLTVSNTGNIASSGTITIVDVLPSGMSVADGSLTLGGANAANWSCSSTSNVITCTSSTSIAATSGTSVFNFTVDIDPGAAGTAINKAQVGGGGDPLTSTPDETSAGACTGTNTPTKGCAVDSDFINSPSIVLTKTPTLDDTVITPGGVANAGDTITYTFSVENTGNVTVTNIIVTDPLLPSLSCTIASLASGATSSCTATNNVYTLTQADINAGSRANTATATGKDPGNNDVTDTDSQTTTLNQSPSIVLTKTPALDDTVVAPNGTANAGDTITYTFSVENTGNVTVTNITVTDPLLPTLSCTITSLAPGATSGCTATNNVYTLTQADVNAGSRANTATATGKDPGNNDVTDTDTQNVTLTSAPVIQLTKTGTLNDDDGTAGLSAGDTISYAFTVTNTGNVTLTNITLADTVGGVTINGGPIASLVPGASDSATFTGSYTVTQADIDAGTFTNTATVTGTPPSGSDVTDPDDDTQTLTGTPALTLDKTFDGYTDNDTSTTLTLGDDLNFTITLTNTGNTTLTTVAVSDPQLTPNSANCASVAPGGACALTGSYTVTQADVDAGQFQNTAVVTDDDVCPSAGTATCEDSVTTNIPQTPAINIVKSPSTQNILSGGTANFTLTVTNTGNVTLTGVTVTDAQCTSGPTLTGGDTNNDTQLQLTETWIYSCSVTNVTADFTNTADVSTNEGATDSDTADVTVTVLQADLELDKSVSNATPLVATDIDFTITVTNIGPDAATGVQVTDVIPSGFTYTNGNYTASQGTYAGGVWDIGDLALNQTETLTITVTVNLSGNYTNYAEVTAVDQVDPDSTPNNDSTTEDDDDSVTVTPIQDDPSTGKTVTDSNQAFTTGTNVAIGEIVTYTVAVDIPPGIFANAQLVDKMERGLSFMTCSSITESDPALTTDLAGSFTDACTNPTVDNGGGSTTVDDGRRVTFDLGTITNSSGTDQTLSFEYTAVVLDSAANVSGATLDNSAEFTSDSGVVSPSTATVTILEPDLSIAKTSSASLVSVGSEVTFTLEIQHTSSSEANAYDVLVEDVLPAELDYVPGSIECVSGAQDADVLCDYDAGTRRISAIWSNFTLGGGNGRITFRVTVASLPSGGISNTANVAWTSLPNDVSAPQNSNIFSTERDYDPASFVDVYGASSTLVLNVFGNNPGSGQNNLLPATGFAPNVVTDLGNVGKETYAATGGLTVEIPSLQINIPIVGVPLKNGEWNVAWLGNQAGWLEGSAFPSWNGNSVLTGHVYGSNGLSGPFVNLNKLKYGDRIIVHAYGQKYIFAVTANNVVEPNDASIFKHEEKPWLTLVTCKEYDEKTNTYKKRDVVRAVLVSVAWE